jgi:hypothetical protein
MLLRRDMSSPRLGKSLVEKLGIKSGFKLAILNAPAGYRRTLGELPKHVIIVQGTGRRLDFVQVFSTETGELEKKFPRAKASLRENGMLWISWPKSSSGMQKSLSENSVRAIGLKNGLVDVKICSLDANWSALKFVRRIKERRG